MKRLLTTLLLLVPTVALAQTSESLRRDVEYLAADQRAGRYTASKGLAEAQEYIIENLKTADIPSFRQPVKTDYGDCRNIVAYIEGTRPTEGYIVVGAHLDHIGHDRWGRVLNGADDNASGSAAILALAKRLKQTRPIRSVIFVWFTGEETGLSGSRQFVKQPFDGDNDSDNKLPVFMLNLDMVGRLSDNMSDEKDTKPGQLAPLFKKYAFAERITFQGMSRGSDHKSFYNKNVPTIFLHTGVYGQYHHHTDDSNTLDYPGMMQICNYAYDIILLIAGEQPEVDYNLQ